MIWDCFMFFNELDLLEIRLTELAPVVDKFVIVESSVTFSGKPKPMHLWENQARFKPWLDKIVYVISPNRPHITHPRERLTLQRNAISVGLSGAKGSDWVLVSDLDEIPRPKRVTQWSPKLGPRKFRAIVSYYWVNCISTERWAATVITTANALKTSTPEQTRFARTKGFNKGGWHFSYMGGPEAIQTKLGSFAHTELDIPKFNSLENIKRSMGGVDLFSRKIQFKFVELNPSFPHSILANRKKYAHLIHS